MFDKVMMSSKLVDWDMVVIKGNPYLSLVYEIEDENGNKNKLEIPKLYLPIEKIEVINRDYGTKDYSYWDENKKKEVTKRVVVKNDAYIGFKSGITLKALDGMTESGSVRKFMFSPIVKKVTIDDIEKQFGCKVEIIEE